jgi:hypothetical protein
MIISQSLLIGSKYIFNISRKRNIVTWLTNYPDKVMQKKKVQMAGGTCNHSHPTWLKQPGDKFPLIFVTLLLSYGSFYAVCGQYKLATGKGKIE